eukprot:COSAG05_NODE_27_length_29281_cov_199.946919_4_plen_81_part_00
MCVHIDWKRVEIYKEGGVARAMYIIEAGRVEIRRYEMCIGVLEPGSFFGEEGIVHTVRAISSTRLSNKKKYLTLPPALTD